RVGVDWVVWPTREILLLPALRPGMIEIERERDHLALLQEPRRRDDVFGRRIIERSNFVIGPPFAPVLVLLRSIAHVLAGDLSGDHLISSDEKGMKAPEYSL